MNELFSFIVRHSKWLIFTIFVAISCVLLFNSDPYRQHLFLTSAGNVASGVYGTANNITSYFNLRDVNDDLNRQNAELQTQINELREQLTAYQELAFADTLKLGNDVAQFNFTVAHVINNSIARPYNYITINKGSADGIEPELGVIDRNGVVGIVSNVGTHASRVISLLNPNFRLSCKLKATEYFGSLVWDGNNPTQALLEELPRHTVFNVGDTIVTSGYSAVFPANLPVGVVLDGGDEEEHNQNFFTLKVRLFADFTTLSNVQIVRNNQAEELRTITAGEENDYKRKPFGN